MTSHHMPPEVREVYEALHEECAWLHQKWQIFTELFEIDKDPWETLNETAGTFFVYLRTIMSEDVAIGISKLKDPKRTGRNRNLTLRRMLAVIDDTHYPYLFRQVEENLERLERDVNQIRQWRNRGIAHLDLPTAIDPQSNPLPGVTVVDIDTCLSGIADVLNAVRIHFESQSGDYAVTTFTGGPDSLFHYLRLGLEKHKESLK